jgi:hypothetical protein
MSACSTDLSAEKGTHERARTGGVGAEKATSVARTKMATADERRIDFIRRFFLSMRAAGVCPKAMARLSVARDEVGLGMVPFF